MLLFTEGMAGAEFEEARGMSNWDTWIEQKATEAIYNPTMTYDVVHPSEGSSSGMKSELYEKLENWRRGVIIEKKHPPATFLFLLTDKWQTTLSLRAGMVVIWLPRNAEIKALDKDIFRGTYGVVRRVTIHGAPFIPSWIEGVGKTLKARNSLENHKMSVQLKHWHVQ